LRHRSSLIDRPQARNQLTQIGTGLVGQVRSGHRSGRVGSDAASAHHCHRYTARDAARPTTADVQFPADYTAYNIMLCYKQTQHSADIFLRYRHSVLLTKFQWWWQW